MILIRHTCRGCGRTFEQLATNGRTAGWYCDGCRDALVQRTCDYKPCGAPFTVPYPHYKQRYHSAACAFADGAVTGRRRSLPMAVCRYCGKTFYPSTADETSFCCLDHYHAFRQEQAGGLHICALAECPRPQELIRAGRKYHPECYRVWRVAWYRAGGARKGKGKGRVLACQDCGREVGYRRPRQLGQKRCAPCERARKHAWHMGRRVTVTCAWCWKIGNYAGARFKVAPFRAKATKHHFHSRAHSALYFHSKRRPRPPCPCGEEIRTREARLCRKCAAAAKRGKPLVHTQPSKAEERIQAAWDAGVRGVRALARESSQGLDFRTSTTTVMKMLKAGKLVEPAAGV